MGFPTRIDEGALCILGALGWIPFDPLPPALRPVVLCLQKLPSIARQGILLAALGDRIKLLQL
eukprot:10859567-Alexandrium_andersonii.AAC.1